MYAGHLSYRLFWMSETRSYRAVSLDGQRWDVRSEPFECGGEKPFLVVFGDLVHRAVGGIRYWLFCKALDGTLHYRAFDGLSESPWTQLLISSLSLREGPRPVAPRGEVAVRLLGDTSSIESPRPFRLFMVYQEADGVLHEIEFTGTEWTIQPLWYQPNFPVQVDGDPVLIIVGLTHHAVGAGARLHTFARMRPEFSIFEDVNPTEEGASGRVEGSDPAHLCRKLWHGWRDASAEGEWVFELLEVPFPGPPGIRKADPAIQPIGGLAGGMTVIHRGGDCGPDDARLSVLVYASNQVLYEIRSDDGGGTWDWSPAGGEQSTPPMPF